MEPSTNKRKICFSNPTITGEQRCFLIEDIEEVHHQEDSSSSYLCIGFCLVLIVLLIVLIAIVKNKNKDEDFEYNFFELLRG